MILAPLSEDCFFWLSQSRENGFFGVPLFALGISVPMVLLVAVSVDREDTVALALKGQEIPQPALIPRIRAGIVCRRNNLFVFWSIRRANEARSSIDSEERGLICHR